MIFLSTPSLRRATCLWYRFVGGVIIFLSTPSLRRATRWHSRSCPRTHISIHALLAEGDHGQQVADGGRIEDFYPRPPCGGRQTLRFKGCGRFGFLSTPSLRRATPCRRSRYNNPLYFYPRPPCGGRRTAAALSISTSSNFYPRPPCGGRRFCRPYRHDRRYFYPRPPCGGRPTECRTPAPSCYFYPRPPCGGRPDSVCDHIHARIFLSTPSLRRATRRYLMKASDLRFLSTPSLRRAT